MAMTLKFGSFSIAGCQPFPGVVLESGHVIALSALAGPCRARNLSLTGTDSLQGLLADWDRNLASIRQLLADGYEPDAVAPLDHLRRHAPIAAPRQIICSGANYRKHVIDMLLAQGGGAVAEGQSAEERRVWATKIMDDRAATGIPYAFIKAASAIAGPDDDLAIPDYANEPDWELELAVVIGREGFRLSRDNAMGHVAGYMIANDVTARDWVYRRDDMKVLGTDWLASKSAPGFLPTGPYLVPRDEVADWRELTITLTINGQIMQNESTADMIFDIPRQIEHISRYIPLVPGDVICTGSPAGNGVHHKRYLQDGDLMEGSITGLGTQHVRCVATRVA
jgi:2-keto-4-pentenoate hydratase/2-oxohepta-3-ene-1,7-dioic acid hydratase in catechol pathway